MSAVTLTQRMQEDMQLRGFAPRTQDSYLRAVSGWAAFCGRPRDALEASTEDDVRRFFLHLVTDRKVSRSTLTVYRAGVRFLVEVTLARACPVLDRIRPMRRHTLPVVLSRTEVRQLLSAVRDLRSRMCLITIYSCGLRLSEGLALTVADIDSQRMVVRVRQGKGGRDRYVPLADRTLVLLREYWQACRPAKPWLFPNRHGTEPLCQSSLQRTFTAVVRASGLEKQASIHTLWHSYPTHLLECGVHLRVIQELLGHQSPQTTAIYTPISRRPSRTHCTAPSTH
jgi:site-specific recombinase XerD